MREELVKILEEAGEQLVEGLDPDNGLFTSLLSKGVLNQRQVFSSKAKPTPHERVESVLEYLKRSDDKNYNIFRDILVFDMGRLQLVKDCLPLDSGPSEDLATVNESSTGGAAGRSVLEPIPPSSRTRNGNGSNKTHATGAASKETENPVRLLDLANYVASKQKTPQVVCTLRRVGDCIRPKKRRSAVKSFFDMYLDDPTALVRALVFNRGDLNKRFKLLEGKQIRLLSGTYTVSRSTDDKDRPHKFYVNMKHVAEEA